MRTDTQVVGTHPSGTGLRGRGDVETPALLHKADFAQRGKLAVQGPPQLMTHLQCNRHADLPALHRQSMQTIAQYIYTTIMKN